LKLTTPSKAAVPNFPPQPPTKTLDIDTCQIPAKIDAAIIDPYVMSCSGDDIAMKVPQKTGHAIDSGKMSADKSPITLTAATELDRRPYNALRYLGTASSSSLSASSVIVSFQYVIMSAPTTVKTIDIAKLDNIFPIEVLEEMTEVLAPLFPAVVVVVSSSAAPELMGLTNDDTINWSVHAHCAMKPNRPPIPTNQLCLSNTANMPAQTNPKIIDSGHTVGITDNRAIPAKLPQNAATDNCVGSSNNDDDINPTILDDMIGPTLNGGRLFNINDDTVPTKTAAMT
jgi:hypothetical protein